MALESYHIIEINLYYPENVKDVLGIGSSCFIGLINDTTVIKYPHYLNDNTKPAALAIKA